MDEKDKKSDFSIKSTFQSWLDIQEQEKVAFIFGNTAVGKTTVCQLIKKIIDNNPHPNLKLVEKKKDWQYECEGEINPKSIKPLTNYPKKYYIKEQQICIIEVPSRIYSLQKKRPFIDRILNTVGLAYSAHQGSFIFAIDAKNTSGKCDPWKKTFQTIFESFDINLLNEKTFKSVGFVVISKSASNDFEKDAFLNRFEDFYKLFDEQKRKNQYYQLLKTIQNEKNLSVFKKTTQNQQIIGKDIVQIFQLIKKLSKQSIPLQKQLGQNFQMINIEPTMLEKQEESHFDKFNQTLGIIFDFFAKFFQALFVKQTVNIQNFRLQDLAPINQNENDSEIFLKKIWPAELNMEQKKQKIVRNKLNELRTISSKNNNFYQHSLGKASLLIQYKQKIQLNNETSNKTLATFLELLANHGLIEQSCAQLPQLESLYCQMIQYSIFQERFGPFIKNINYKKMLNEKNVAKHFGELSHTITKMRIHEDFINNKFMLNVNSQQARKYLKIIDKFFTNEDIVGDYQKSIPVLKKNLVLLTFDRSDPQKAIVQIDMLLNKIVYQDKILEEIHKNQQNPSSQIIKQIQFLNSLALEIAKVLQKYGQYDLSAQIFHDCGNFHSAIQCYQLELKKNQNKQSQNLQKSFEIINSYLELLIDLDLYQKALQQCYEFAQNYKPYLVEINKKRKQIKQRRLLPYDEEKQRKLQEIFLKIPSKLFRFYSNKKVLGKIKEIAQKNRK